MAEATVALILSLLYDLKGTEAVLRQGLPRPRTQAARMLSGRTIGLIGLGRIGAAVQQRLAGWNARFLVADPYLPRERVPAGIEKVDLAELLSQSDIVSLHVPLTAETRHMIGTAEIAAMKPEALLVNTSRGGLIDEAAATEAIRSGKLGGLGLDTFEIEPLPEDSPLRELPRTILTPHMIGHTREIYDAIGPTLVDALERVAEGLPPRYLRNPDVLDAWRARMGAIGA
jgi:D-3-phosphoglycerate dehydrogenase